jgi:hypothetical protein
MLGEGRVGHVGVLFILNGCEMGRNIVGTVRPRKMTLRSQLRSSASREQEQVQEKKEHDREVGCLEP